ncbi:hypothetical protein JB92DRAFT_2906530 [Gautieria morchelliformis]|nr:hypothetical protein JB92DRAFT_2906530 [Gautieria morchelliformis]
MYAFACVVRRAPRIRSTYLLAAAMLLNYCSTRSHQRVFNFPTTGSGAMINVFPITARRSVMRQPRRVVECLTAVGLSGCVRRACGVAACYTVQACGLPPLSSHICQVPVPWHWHGRGG